MMLVLSSWSFSFYLGIRRRHWRFQPAGYIIETDILSSFPPPKKAVKITRTALNMALLQSKKGVYHVLDFSNAIVRY